MLTYSSFILPLKSNKKSHQIASNRFSALLERLRAPPRAKKREKTLIYKPGLLGNGKRVSFRSLVEFPFSLFIFLDLEPHVTHIARRLNKKLAKKVSQKRPKGCPRRSKSLQKSTLNTSKMESGGSPRLLGELDFILAISTVH